MSHGAPVEEPLVVSSPSESARFGLHVGRLVISSGQRVDSAAIDRAVTSAELDVIVLRYPAVEVQLFAELSALSGFETLYADTLLHWEWRHVPGHTPHPVGASLRLTTVSADRVGDIVRTVFADYPNHYAANPLLGRAAALDGYVEWATTSVSSGDAIAHLLIDADGGSVGFAVVDRSAALPDVLLAGIEPAHRGRGRYGDLIRAVMHAEVGAGSTGLTISTQAHHVTVMAAWARLGWLPLRAVTTVHLVRRGLLDRGLRETAE